MLVFRKIRRVLFSCNTRFEICLFSLLPTKRVNAPYSNFDKVETIRF